MSKNILYRIADEVASYFIDLDVEKIESYPTLTGRLMELSRQSERIR